MLAGACAKGLAHETFTKAQKGPTSSVHLTSCYVLSFSVYSTQLESDTSSTIPAEVHGAGLAHIGRCRIPAALTASGALDLGKSLRSSASLSRRVCRTQIEVAASAAASAGVHCAVLVHNASLAPQGMHRSLMSKMK